ncbi:hypothetical protein [Enterococcus sp. BWR-S5]|nr:hypothetical protein [Enterococcus sp. BWR-S5]MBL1224820.1 hypothetical protein [Enterococcus sp. BWR-S5]
MEDKKVTLKTKEEYIENISEYLLQINNLKHLKEIREIVIYYYKQAD